MTRVGDMERAISRRKVLQLGAAGAGALVTRLDKRFELPNRISRQNPSRLPEIQFAIGDFLAPVRTNIGRSFDWMDETSCSMAGRYTLRTPYPSREVRILGGGVARKVGVTETMVERGDGVTADLAALSH